MKARLFLSFMVAACFLLPRGAEGHGGQYKGPNDLVPPNLGGPGGNVTVPGAAPTPGPAMPSTGNHPEVGKAVTPRGSITGMRTKPRGSIPLDRWEFWWECNKAAFLNLRSRMERLGNLSGTDGFLTGRGRKYRVRISLRPSQETVQGIMVPVLMKALEAEHPDILDSAAMALAKITRAEDAGPVLPALEGVLAKKYSTARESAVLAMGVLGAPRAVPLLYELMVDGAQGRRRMGVHEVPPRARAFAALSLGFIENPNTVDRLFTVIRRAPDRDRELRCCAVTALGLTRGSPRKDEVVNFLLQLLDDRKLDPFVKASVPTALGKIGDPAALPGIIRAFKAPRQDKNVRRSCAIALGRLARIDDREVTDLLMGYIKEGKDAPARHFCFISLGRIGARDPRFEAHPDLHRRLLGFLLRQVTRPASSTSLPWAALGAAIHARRHEALQATVIEKAAERFRLEKSPSPKAALAVCLGLLQAAGHAGDLVEVLEKTRDTALKGYLCVALGLMNHRPAAGAIRGIALQANHSFRLRLQAATALGLLGDRSIVPPMIQALEEGHTLSTVTSAAKALGILGDRSAVAPLRRIVEDETRPALARGFACVALGLLAEKTDLPWNSVITEDYNYCAMPSAVAEVIDIL